MRASTRRFHAFFRRLLRAVKIIVRDERIPRPLRWGGALAALPVPGPFDEAVLLIVGCALWLFYREQLAGAWRQAAAALALPSSSTAA